MSGFLVPTIDDPRRFCLMSVGDSSSTLTSGDVIEVRDSRGQWIRGSVEFEHRRKLYVFSEALDFELWSLASIADRQLSVRLP